MTNMKMSMANQIYVDKILSFLNCKTLVSTQPSKGAKIAQSSCWIMKFKFSKKNSTTRQVVGSNGRDVPFNGRETATQTTHFHIARNRQCQSYLAGAKDLSLPIFNWRDRVEKVLPSYPSSLSSRFLVSRLLYCPSFSAMLSNCNEIEPAARYG